LTYRSFAGRLSTLSTLGVQGLIAKYDTGVNTVRSLHLKIIRRL